MPIAWSKALIKIFIIEKSICSSFPLLYYKYRVIQKGADIVDTQTIEDFLKSIITQWAKKLQKIIFVLWLHDSIKGYLKSRGFFWKCDFPKLHFFVF